MQAIPHTANAILATFYTAKLFVDHARLSNNVYPPDALMYDVIWNYNSTYTGLQVG